jgi:hypothetical protein
LRRTVFACAEPSMRLSLIWIPISSKLTLMPSLNLP